jgi:hypothetical protein
MRVYGNGVPEDRMANSKIMLGNMELDNNLSFEIRAAVMHLATSADAFDALITC